MLWEGFEQGRSERFPRGGDTEVLLWRLDKILVGRGGILFSFLSSIARDILSGGVNLKRGRYGE